MGRTLNRITYLTAILNRTVATEVNLAPIKAQIRDLIATALEGDALQSEIAEAQAAARTPVMIAAGWY